MASRKKTGNRRAESAVSAVAEQNLVDAIRQRAYELYVERGRTDGSAEEDWLRAEAEILSLRRAGNTEGSVKR